MGQSPNYGVSVVGVPQNTGISAQCGMTDMLSHFTTASGLLGRLDIENIVFNGTGSGQANHCWTLQSLTGDVETNLACGGANGLDYWAENGDPSNMAGANFATQLTNDAVAAGSIQQMGLAVWTAPSGGNGAWTLVTPATTTYVNQNPPAFIWPAGYLTCSVVGTYTVTMTAGKPTAVTTSGYTCPAVPLTASVPDMPKALAGWRMNAIDARVYNLQCYDLGTGQGCIYNGGGDVVGDMHVGLSPTCYYEQGILNKLHLYFDNCYHVGIDWEQPRNTYTLSSDWSQWKTPGAFDIYLGAGLYSTSAMSTLLSHTCGANTPTGGNYTQFGGTSGAIVDNGLSSPYFPAYLEISASQNCITNYVVNRHANSVVAGTNNAGIDAASVSTIASATTIAPTTKYVFVTGTTPIQTMTPPPGCTTSGTDCAITLIADPATGPFTIGTSGNFYAAASPAIGTKTAVVYNPATSKWY